MIQIFDFETGKLLEATESGEVCVRGKGNMIGYLNNVQATFHAIDDKGWLHTGICSLGWQHSTFKLMIYMRPFQICDTGSKSSKFYCNFGKRTLNMFIIIIKHVNNNHITW